MACQVSRTPVCAGYAEEARCIRDGKILAIPKEVVLKTLHGLCALLPIVLLILIAGASLGEATPIPVSPAAPPATDVATRLLQLHSLFESEWEYELKASPERATAMGDNRYNDRLSDDSAEFYQSDLQHQKESLIKFEAI